MSINFDKIKQYQEEFMKNLVRTTYSCSCEDKLDYNIFRDKYYPKEESKDELQQ